MTLTGLFLLANALGFAAATRLQRSPAVQEAAAQYQEPAAGFTFFAVIGVATLVLLALYRYDQDLLVKIWFGSALFLTMFIFFDAVLPPVAALPLAVLVFAARFRTDDVMQRNLLDTVSFAGAGALFGSLLGYQAAFVLYGLLAVYDYVAVNMSGHMVDLATQGAATDTFMGFTYPKEEGATVESVADAANMDGGTEAQVGVLGGGDVIVPMIFAVSLLGPLGPGATVATMLGAAAALYVFMTRLTGEKFYPAIPVVGSGSLVGLLAWLVIAVVV